MRINPINNTAAMPQLSTTRNIQPRYGYISEPVNEPAQQDSVSFKGLFRKKINVSLENAKYCAKTLSSSSSGNKAEYFEGKGLKDQVKLISLGIAGYVSALAAKDLYDRKPVVLIGGDEGEATKKSLDVAKKTLKKQGVDVLEVKQPVSTPMLALAAKENNVDLAVLMTTSRNFWHGGEYNLITRDGAVAPQKVAEDVAKRIEEIAEKGSYKQKIFKRGNDAEIDPYYSYRFELMDNVIDWRNIKDSGLKVYYDGLSGAGSFVFPKLLDSFGIPNENVVSASESLPRRYRREFSPTKENLNLLSYKVSNDNQNPLRIGLATDAEAEGFGVVDEKGNFISPNDVLLLAAYHLVENRGQEGTVIRSQATSSQLDKLAENYGLKKIETPVGFKYITEDIMKLRENNEDILVAGEESGGLTIMNHIPEKDGIMAISLIMDLVAEEGKPISEILKDVKQNLGKHYAADNFSIYLGLEANPKAIMSKITEKVEKLYKDAVELCEDDLGDDIHTIDSYKTEDLRTRMKDYTKEGDGIKFIMIDGSTVFVRPDETDPKIKCYVEATGNTDAAAKENAEGLKMFMEEFLSI